MLLSRCRQLKKLSLEHVTLNDDICNDIAKNTQLEALNLAMCSGLEAWSVRKIMESLKQLNSLNISWTNLSVDAVTSLVTNVTPNLMRLNVAGCRKTMFDSRMYFFEFYYKLKHSYLIYTSIVPPSKIWPV